MKLYLDPKRFCLVTEDGEVVEGISHIEVRYDQTPIYELGSSSPFMIGGPPVCTVTMQLEMNMSSDVSFVSQTDVDAAASGLKQIVGELDARTD